jgi:hypothetical protein
MIGSSNLSRTVHSFLGPYAQIMLFGEEGSYSEETFTALIEVLGA